MTPAPWLLCCATEPALSVTPARPCSSITALLPQLVDPAVAVSRLSRPRVASAY